MKHIASLVPGLIVILTLSLCSNPDHPKTTVQKMPKDTINHVVTLSIDNGNGKTAVDLFFYYHDSLYQSHGIRVNSNQVNFSLNAPALLLDAINKQTPYLVYPGEKLHIRNAATDSIRMYIEGNAQRTNELDFFRKLVKETGDIWYFLPAMPYHKQVNSLNQIHDLEKKINEVMNVRLKFLASYIKQFPVSDGFITTAAKCIKITAISDSLYLHRRNQAMLAEQSLYKPFVISKTASIERIGFMPNQFYYRACSDLVDMIGSAGDNSSLFTKSFDFINKNFTGLTRDYLLAKAVYSDFKNKTPISKDELAKFNAECKNKGYRDQIHKILNDNKKAFAYAKGSNKLLSLDGKTVQDLKEVIAKYKGKLVLFDFWASWCIPCREEMPRSAILKKKYQDKNIVFVTISTDANVADWKKAAKEEALESDHNFLLLNADQASFTKRYGINTIPRYMLIGKDGKVLIDDAPRPGNQKLAELINQYL